MMPVPSTATRTSSAPPSAAAIRAFLPAAPALTGSPQPTVRTSPARAATATQNAASDHATARLPTSPWPTDHVSSPQLRAAVTDNHATRACLRRCPWILRGCCTWRAGRPGGSAPSCKSPGTCSPTRAAHCGWPWTSGHWFLLSPPIRFTTGPFRGLPGEGPAAEIGRPANPAGRNPRGTNSKLSGMSDQAVSSSIRTDSDHGGGRSANGSAVPRTP